ncbi:MAG: hypothetical protein ABI967_01395 [bacterium]
MAEFRPGQAVQTETPEIEVTVTATAPLPPGRHHFQLVVEDDSGNRSEPSVTEVIVRDTTKPTAVIDGPREVEVGRNFQLSGKRSSDIGGKIVRYTWTRLD